jgi:hypothetical protein
VTFSEDDKEKFALMDDFGVPLASLKQIIDMKALIELKQINLEFQSIL